MSGISGIGHITGLPVVASTLAVGGTSPAPAAVHLAASIPNAPGNLSAAAKPVFDALVNLAGGAGKGLVSFNVAQLPSIQVPVLTSAPGVPASSKPHYLLPSSPELVGRLSATVVRFAASAIYPAPLFSFSA